MNIEELKAMRNAIVAKNKKEFYSVSVAEPGEVEEIEKPMSYTELTEKYVKAKEAVEILTNYYASIIAEATKRDPENIDNVTLRFYPFLVSTQKLEKEERKNLDFLYDMVHVAICEVYTDIHDEKDKTEVYQTDNLVLDYFNEKIEVPSLEFITSYSGLAQELTTNGYSFNFIPFEELKESTNTAYINDRGNEKIFCFSCDIDFEPLTKTKK